MSEPTTTPRVFLKTVEKKPDEPALRYKHLGLWRDISWREYYDKAAAVGAALISWGLEPGDRVGIIGDNAPEWVIADMGVQGAGGVAVGIYATNAAEQVEYVAEHAGAKFLFAENEEQLDKWLAFADRLPGLLKVIVWDAKGLDEFSDPRVTTFEKLLAEGDNVLAQDPGIYLRRAEAVRPGDMCVLIYTSGTTGPPKGAILTHRNVTWMAEAVLSENPLFPNDEVLSFLPLCHIFERLFSVFIHIQNGYTVNFIESPDTVTDNMREVSPTVGYAVPRIWEKYHSAVVIRMSEATWLKRTAFGLAVKAGKARVRYLAEGRQAPPHLRLAYGLGYLAVFRKLKERLGFERMRVAYSGAAPISPDVLLFFQAIGVNLVEGYGQTESTGVTCMCRPGEFLPGRVGRPLTGTEVKIAEDGEIMVRSPGIFAGYFKNEKSTAETIEDGWLHSGDVGEMSEDGILRITDRKKDIIVTAGGKNITPQYIESKLKFSPYINDAVVVGDRRKFLAALIVIDEDNVVKYAQVNKIPFSTYRDLTEKEEIKELVGKEVQEVNQGLSRVEQVKKFAILPKKLYEEDGEVTPTMKVKRSYVNKAFGDLIEDLYKGRA